MIVAECERNKEGKIIRFTVKGHAGYGEEGRDIICAAASAVAYTAAGWFETKYNETEESYKKHFEERDGFMRWDRGDYLDKGDKDVTEDDAVLEAMMIGFRQIEQSYGKKYLTIRNISGGAFRC